MPGRRERRRRSIQGPVERVAFWFSWWLVCFVLWLLLVFKTEPLEFAAGALAAALAATAAELVRSRGYAPFAADLRWLLALASVPREVAMDCIVLTAALWRQLTGRRPIQGTFRVIHFEGCAGEDPRSQARRAIAKWRGGIGPNTYVIGFDEERDIVLIHQLVPTARVPNVDPGARLRK